MQRKISCKRDLLMVSLTKFFTINNNINLMLPIVTGKSKISLRVIDWFVTNYSKKNNINYYIQIKKNGELINKQFIVYLNYKSQLKAYSKKQFDPFCRRERILFYHDSKKELVTTVGQLNFFRWAIENDIISYIKKNLKEIESDMNMSIRNIYKNSSSKSLKNKDGKNKKGKPIKVRRKRKELSVNATKSISKHNVTITVKFE
jgi:hypothetical protein